MLTEDIIRPFLSKERSKIPFSKYHKEACDIAEEIDVHACGTYPSKLIDLARPNENDMYKAYRRDVYEPYTKTYWEKSSNVVKKIDKSDNFNIAFPEQKGTYKNDATLEEYINESFPFFDSLRGWVFGFFLDRMLADPNAVCLVLPLPKNDVSDDTELLRPYPLFFKSEDVYYYEENRLCVVLTEQKSPVKEGKNTVYEGNIFLAADYESYSIITQVGEKNDYSYVIETFYNPVTDKNGNKYMPAIQSGGVIKELDISSRLYESFFSGAIPMFNEAVRRYSDHQVNMALHLHPDRWEIQDTECRTCSGKGVINTPNKTGAGHHSRDCHTCGGFGKVSYKSPFGVKLIKIADKVNINDAVPVPTPPAGYITRPIETIAYLEEEVQRDIKAGLSAFNFEWVMRQPADASGVSKMYDKQEQNAFLGTIASHLVNNIFYPIIFYINEQRYQYLGAARFENLPQIEIPEDFDVVYTDAIMSNINTAKTAGAPSSMLNQLYLAWSQKEFGKNSDQHKINVLTLQVDPLPNKTSDEKSLELTSGGCTKIQFIVSCQITALINEAINTIDDFLSLEYIKQKDIIYKMASDINDQNKASIIPIVASDGSAG